MDVRLFLRVILCSGLMLSACSDESLPQKPGNTDTDENDDDDDDGDTTSSHRDAGHDAGKRDAGRDAGKRDAGDDEEADDDEEVEDDEEAEDDEETTSDAGVNVGTSGPVVAGGNRNDASTGRPPVTNPGTMPMPMPTPTPEPEPDACATAAAPAQNLINRKCTGCHAAGRTSPPLTSVAEIKAQTASIIDRVTTDDPSRWMPRGLTPLPAGEQQSIVQWMKCLQN